MASTTCLTDLARTVQEAATPVPSLRTFLCAGAPIPSPLVEQARAALGAYGPTEQLTEQTLAALRAAAGRG